MERHIPPGYRFAPTDDEIVTHYLYNKVHRKPLSSSAVKDCDLYGDENAWIQIFEQTGETALYFFTSLKKKAEKGCRVERETSCGTWRSQKDTKIFSHCSNRKQHIGSRRNFTFISKKGSNQVKGRWVMHEYRLDGVLLNARNDYVLCRIKKKKPPAREEQKTVIPMSSAVDHHINNTNEAQALDFIDSNDAQYFDSMLLNLSDIDLSLGISLEDLDD